MTILDRIIANKIKEVELRMKVFPQTFWEQSPWFEQRGLSLSQGLKNSPTASSPSTKGVPLQWIILTVICPYTRSPKITASWSHWDILLTDQKYFGGSLEDLTAAGQNAKSQS